MRAQLTLVAIIGAFAIPIAAQQAEFSLFPDAPNKIAFRGGTNVPNALLTQADATTFRGVGQTQTGSGVVGRMTGFRFEVQDENGATPAPLAWVVRRTPTGLDLFDLAFQLPPGNVGVERSVVTVTLGTPFDGLPQTDVFHYGVVVPAATPIPTDFVSVLANSEADALPKAGAPVVSFSVEPFIGATPTSLSFATGLMTDGVTLVPGAIVDASDTWRFGRPGLYPDRAAGYGYVFRLDAGSGRRLRPYFVVGGLPVGFGPATPLVGFEGDLYLLPPLLPALMASGVLNRVGKAEVANLLIPFGFPIPVGRLYHQALVAGPSFVLSNACRTDET